MPRHPHHGSKPRIRARRCVAPPAARDVPAAPLAEPTPRPQQQPGVVDWVNAHREALKVEAERRDADASMLERALDLVRAFIVERGLIVFGGLAIDYALQLRGKGIYPEGSRPDYDFVSPRHADDAYELADRLHAAGFERVSVVRAMHVQTMRVRTNFRYVADIGYAPPDVFALIPHLMYRDVRVVHPDYQRIDLHLAFCYPFNSPPREDVYHRWRKDSERFAILDAAYPIGPAAAMSSPPIETTVGIAAPFADVAISGLAAYAVYCRLAGSPSAVAASFEGGAAGGRVTVRAPAELGDAERRLLVHVASPDPFRVAARPPGEPPAEMHYPYMDTGPETLHAGQLRVESTADRLLSVKRVRYDDGQLVIVSIHYLLRHFLVEALRSPRPDAREANRTVYADLLRMKKKAEAVDSPADFLGSPFSPSVDVIGESNRTESSRISEALLRLKIAPNEPLPSGMAALVTGLPSNYYPARGQPDKAKAHPPFDYAANPLFRRSGEPKTPS